MAALRSVNAAKMHKYFASCGYPLATCGDSDTETTVVVDALVVVNAALASIASMLY